MGEDVYKVLVSGVDFVIIGCLVILYYDFFEWVIVDFQFVFMLILVLVDYLW